MNLSSQLETVALVEQFSIIEEPREVIRVHTQITSKIGFGRARKLSKFVDPK